MRPTHNTYLALLLMFALFCTPAAWCAPRYKVLHSFTGGDDGGTIWSGLLLDAKGNLYGTTFYGGVNHGGTVFELSPGGGGIWTETTLWSFDGADGTASTAGVVFDASGNLYGTTETGGGPYSYGVVYELSSQQDGTWKETVLHTFHTGDYGGSPYAGVTIDSAGNLYGTGPGGVYELSPGSGGWTYDVLHEFCVGNDGCEAFAGVIRDAAGNLYGTTQLGGSDKKDCGGGCGTVYRLHPKPDGGWQETILHNFTAGSDGDSPGTGALIMDKLGNLYGTTETGAIYKLASRPHGPWKETTLYDAPGEPVGGVVMDKSGALYGTTSAGGSTGCGVVYKLGPAVKGKWRYTVLHNLLGSDGCEPSANLILDSKGNLYGTAAIGGAYGYGVAFELTP
jgi:uncharacterized repeat protein (TIGR03803 family)